MIHPSGTELAINIGTFLELSSFGRTGLCQSIVQMITGESYDSSYVD